MSDFETRSPEIAASPASTGTEASGARRRTSSLQLRGVGYEQGARMLSPRGGDAPVQLSEGEAGGLSDETYSAMESVVGEGNPLGTATSVGSTSVAAAQFGENLHNAALTQDAFGDLLSVTDHARAVGDLPTSGALGRVGQGADILGATMSVATIIEDGANIHSLDTQMAAADLVATGIGQLGPVGQAFSMGWGFGRTIDDFFGISDAISALGIDDGRIDMSWVQLVDALAAAGEPHAQRLGRMYRQRMQYEDRGAASRNNLSEMTDGVFAPAHQYSSSSLREHGQDLAWEDAYESCVSEAPADDYMAGFTCMDEASDAAPSPDTLNDRIEDEEDALHELIEEYLDVRREAAREERSREQRRSRARRGSRGGDSSGRSTSRVRQ